MPAKTASTTMVSIWAAYFDSSLIPSSGFLDRKGIHVSANQLLGHHHRRRVLPGFLGRRIKPNNFVVNFIEALHPGCTRLLVPVLDAAAGTR